MTSETPLQGQPEDGSLECTRTLLEQYRDGDEQAGNELFERHVPAVFRFVRAQVGPALAARVDYEDIVQETLLEAFEALDSFEPKHPGSFLVWLGKVASHKVLRAAAFHGREKRTAVQERRFDPNQSRSAARVRLPPNWSTPAQQVLLREQERILDECVHTLSEKHRELILLRGYAGLGFDEIARAVGLANAEVARVSHYRAKDALKAELQRRGHACE